MANRLWRSWRRWCVRARLTCWWWIRWRRWCPRPSWTARWADGRDAVAGMLADPAVLAWFRPGFVDIDAEFPHPLLGLETDADRAAWPGQSMTARCAMRWRGTVRQMARLRGQLSAGQMVTFRYEDVIRRPADAAAALSDFLST